jgi:hypothetical protein
MPPADTRAENRIDKSINVLGIVYERKGRPTSFITIASGVIIVLIVMRESGFIAYKFNL